MATFFTKLPLEIRNLIYEELLLDETPIGLQCDRGLDRKQLCPSILCTCKRAYAEGSSILYERNVFRVGPTSLHHHHFVNCDLQNKNFLRVKHLELAYDDEVQLRILGIDRSEASRLTTVMTTLAKFDCTLRTLRLDFDISKEIEMIDESSQDGSYITTTVTARALQEFVLQEDFREAVVNLKVEGMIKLAVTTCSSGYCNIFQELTDAIGFKKKWTVTEDPYATPLRPELFKKQWILTPATPATREQVSRLVGEIEESSSMDRVVDVVDEEQ